MNEQADRTDGNDPDEPTRRLFRSVALDRQGYYDARPGGPPRLSVWQRRVRGIVASKLDALMRDEPAPRRILDAGCGRGDFSLALARRFPALEEVLGCDVTPELVALARSGAAGEPRLRFEVGELTQLPLQPGSVDVALCLNVLHHVRTEQLTAALAELARVSARTVILEIKNADSPYFRFHSHRVEGVPIFPVTVANVVERLRPSGFALASRHPIFGWGWLSPLIVLCFDRVSQRK